MDFLKNNWKEILAAITLLGPSVGYGGKKAVNAVEQIGYNKARNEIDSTYNAALVDGMVYKRLYDGCCTKQE